MDSAGGIESAIVGMITSTTPAISTKNNRGSTKRYSLCEYSRKRLYYADGFPAV